MKRKICVVSSGRQDYGHLYWVMKEIEASDKFELNIIVPNNHPELRDMAVSFSLDTLIFRAREVKDIDDAGTFYEGCLDIFRKTKLWAVLVLGDRFETVSAALAATVTNTKLIHLHGGESTKGAFDDKFRNSITAMSDIHFTAHQEYAKNVCRMISKCSPDHYNCYSKYNDLLQCDFDNRPYKDSNVYITGSPGLDWMPRTKLKTKAELQEGLQIDLSKPFILACFQSVTRELENTTHDMGEFLLALGSIEEQVLLIRPNCDPGNEEINDLIDQHLGFSTYDHVKAVDNLDHLTYLSLMKYASMMVGNSSSGIIEAASFGLPVVDIGTRQEGRIKPPNVFSCGYSSKEILECMDAAKRFKQDIGCNFVNPYGDGHASERIVEVLENIALKR